jgi:hypothetical protein
MFIGYVPVLYYPALQKGEDGGSCFVVCLSVHPYWGQRGNEAGKGEFLLFLILLSMKSETNVNWLHLTPV